MFVCITLFNLQGTSFICIRSRRQPDYCITQSPFCQELFSGFFKLFSHRSPEPEIFRFLNLSPSTKRLCVFRSPERSHILSDFFPFVKLFFSFFSTFFRHFFHFFLFVFLGFSGAQDVGGRLGWFGFAGGWCYGAVGTAGERIATTAADGLAMTVVDWWLGAIEWVPCRFATLRGCLTRPYRCRLPWRKHTSIIDLRGVYHI